MTFECAMCDQEIKTSKPIYILTDTLFQANGRWVEHLNTDTYCSHKCVKEVMDGITGEGITDEDGCECSVCSSKFLAGYTATVGWCKTQREKWHRTITTQNYCSHDCMQKDLSNSKSPLSLEVPKKPAKKRKSTKRKTTKKKPAKKKTTKRKKTKK